MAQLSVKHIIKLPQAVLFEADQSLNGEQTKTEYGHPIGSIFNNGQLAWIFSDNLFEVVSLKSGDRISSYNFASELKINSVNVTCVTEIKLLELNSMILAIGLTSKISGSVVCIFAVQGSRPLHFIQMIDNITSCTFLNNNINRLNLLKSFDGCLVVGTDQGKVLLIDLCLEKRKKDLFVTKSQRSNAIVPCEIVWANLPHKDIFRSHCLAKKDNINFGIQLEENAGPVLSLLALPYLETLAVGLGDGRMILYGLMKLEAFHLAYPPEESCPLTKLCFIEPIDDPRACVYIWAFHANDQSAIAVMHSIMFEKKINKNSAAYYENFQSSNVRLTMPIYEHTAVPISCQSISKHLSNDDGMTSLCMLAWTTSNKGSQIMIFDLNQWYKEQMPSLGDWRESPNYIAAFPIDGICPLDIWIHEQSIAQFNSIQRPEEHFYPNSLTFDCFCLRPISCERLHWPGLQNRALDLFNSNGTNAILDPTYCFNEMLNAALIPQFSDYNFSVNSTIIAKRELLLSIALEYNCVGLLKECAKVWADGSHLGRKPFEGLSLSTLTEWIWNRASAIKDCCNNLCTPLFDHSGRHIDIGLKKNLSHCSRQLKLLSELLDMVLNSYQQYIPSDVRVTLNNQLNSIQMASEYQEVLQWLLNMGLLPEGDWVQQSVSRNSSNTSLDDLTPIPYPYSILRNYYMSKRMNFNDLNKNLIVPNFERCKLLYIDAFIEKECNGPVLREEWRKAGGNGLYPPVSLQAMLRILLLPNISIENKYTLFVYLFLDLNMALDEDRYSGVIQNLIKFPAVFKMNTGHIKTTQAFWNLDHGQFEMALEDLVSPLAQDRHISQWQLELLIESLLAQGAPTLALRALRAPGPPASPTLEMKTLLANNLIAEAFQLYKSKANNNLLREFFTGCVDTRRQYSILDIAFTDSEEKMFSEFLTNSESSFTENLHFVYLLQRSKYLEALTLVNNLKKQKYNRIIDTETPSLVLSAYGSTMTPTFRNISDVYYRLHDKINPTDIKRNPDPLSCRLIQDKNICNDNIYHKSALCVEEASDLDWNGRQKQQGIPFLRKPLHDHYGEHEVNNVIFPTIIEKSKKRRLDDLTTKNDVISEYISPMKKLRRGEASIHAADDSFSKAASIYQDVNPFLLTNLKKTSSNQFYHKSNYMDKSNSKLCHSFSTFYSNKNVVDHTEQCLNTEVIDKTPQHIGISTPQSILKTKNAARQSLDSDHVLRENQTSVTGLQEEPDERSIRFKLPANQTTITNSSLDTSTVEPVPQSFERESHSSYNILCRPSVRYSNTSVRSILSTSDDEYFSPQNSVDISSISSANKTVSAVSDDVQNREVSFPELSPHIDSTNTDGKEQLYNRLKPRRSLRSKTPENQSSTKHGSFYEDSELTSKSLLEFPVECNKLISHSNRELCVEKNQKPSFLEAINDSIKETAEEEEVKKCNILTSNMGIECDGNTLNVRQITAEEIIAHDITNNIEIIHKIDVIPKSAENKDNADFITSNFDKIVENEEQEILRIDETNKESYDFCIINEKNLGQEEQIETEEDCEEEEIVEKEYFYENESDLSSNESESEKDLNETQSTEEESIDEINEYEERDEYFERGRTQIAVMAENEVIDILSSSEEEFDFFSEPTTKVESSEQIQAKEEQAQEKTEIIEKSVSITEFKKNAAKIETPIIFQSNDLYKDMEIDPSDDITKDDLNNALIFEAEDVSEFVSVPTEISSNTILIQEETSTPFSPVIDGNYEIDDKDELNNAILFETSDVGQPSVGDASMVISQSKNENNDKLESDINVFNNAQLFEESTNYLETTDENLGDRIKNEDETFIQADVKIEKHSMEIKQMDSQVPEVEQEVSNAIKKKDISKDIRNYEIYLEKPYRDIPKDPPGLETQPDQIVSEKELDCNTVALGASTINIDCTSHPDDGSLSRQNVNFTQFDETDILEKSFPFYKDKDCVSDILEYTTFAKFQNRVEYENDKQCVLDGREKKSVTDEFKTKDTEKTDEFFSRNKRTRSASTDYKPIEENTIILERSKRASSVPKMPKIQDSPRTPARRLSRRLSSIEGSPMRVTRSQTNLDNILEEPQNITPKEIHLKEKSLKKLQQKLVKSKSVENVGSSSRIRRISEGSSTLSELKVNSSEISKDEKMSEHNTGVQESLSRKRKNSSMEMQQEKLTGDDNASEKVIKKSNRNLRAKSKPPSEPVTDEELSKEDSKVEDDCKSDSSSVKSSKKRSTRIFSKIPSEPTIKEESQKEDDSINIENYSTNRRLTRNQLALLEKASKLSVSLQSHDSTQLRLKLTQTQEESNLDESVSDTESVASKNSKISTSSKTKRSLRGQSKELDNVSESGSVASSTRGRKKMLQPVVVLTKAEIASKKSPSPLKSQLSVIAEDEDETVGTSKGKRHQRKKI